MSFKTHCWHKAWKWWLSSFAVVYLERRQYYIVDLQSRSSSLSCFLKRYIQYVHSVEREIFFRCIPVWKGENNNAFASQTDRRWLFLYPCSAINADLEHVIVLWVVQPHAVQLERKWRHIFGLFFSAMFFAVFFISLFWEFRKALATAKP